MFTTTYDNKPTLIFSFADEDELDGFDSETTEGENSEPPPNNSELGKEDTPDEQ